MAKKTSPAQALNVQFDGFIDSLYDKDYKLAKLVQITVNEAVKERKSRFADDELCSDFSNRTFANTEYRSVLKKVKLEATEEDIHNILGQHPNARIVRYLSLSPMLEPWEEQMVDKDNSLYDQFALKQLVRDKEGKVALWKSPQDGRNYQVYRKLALCLSGEVEDTDLRDIGDVYYCEAE